MKLVKLKKIDVKRPTNETHTHYFLKEIGKYILFSMGYHYIATEVYGMWARDLRMQKQIIDVVGLKKKNMGHYQYQWSMCGIEAKASLNDFRHGFCSAPALLYVITPKGTIPLDLIPDKIGLIEVEFNKLKINQFTTKIDQIEGVKILKRARTRIDSRFSSKDAYHEWCKNELESIAYRSTTENLFWRNIIELEKGGIY